MIEIRSIDELTDSYVLEIDDTLFKQTVAYWAFKSKESFIDKVKDLFMRHKMMKTIFIIIKN